MVQKYAFEVISEKLYELSVRTVSKRINCMRHLMIKSRGLNSRNKSTIEYDGWHLSKVADNCVEVIPLEESRIDLQTKIRFCERYSKQQQASIRFKLFTKRSREKIDVLLRKMKYQQVKNQLLMCTDKLSLPLIRNEQASVKIIEDHHPDFDEERQNLHLEELGNGERACICQISVEGLPVGNAFATIKDSHMGIFNVYVTKEYRKNGFGEHIMRALFHWGRDLLAERVYLHVDSDNKPAINLYKKLGFSTESEIWILEKIV